MLTLNVQTFAIGVIQFGFMAILPLYLAVPPVLGFGFGADATAAGLFMLPSTIMMVLIAPATGAVSTRYGAHRALAAGALAIAISTGWFLIGSIDPWEVYTSNALFGAGFGMVVGAISTLVVASVEQDRTGVAAGVNMVSRAIGGALGAPVATALITAGAGVTVENGYRVAFGVFTIAAAAVALVSAFVPFGQPSRTAGDHRGDSRKAQRAGGGRGSRRCVTTI